MQRLPSTGMPNVYFAITGYVSTIVCTRTTCKCVVWSLSKDIMYFCFELIHAYRHHRFVYSLQDKCLLVYLVQKLQWFDWVIKKKLLKCDRVKNNHNTVDIAPVCTWCDDTATVGWPQCTCVTSGRGTLEEGVAKRATNKSSAHKSRMLASFDRWRLVTTVAQLLVTHCTTSEIIIDLSLTAISHTTQITHFIPANLSVIRLSTFVVIFLF